MGPLGTDSGRVRLLRSFVWIPLELQTLLDKLRRQRNQIAHDVGDASNVKLDELFNCPHSELLKTRMSVVLKA